MTPTKPTQDVVTLGPSGATLADVVDVARHGVRVELTAEALDAVAAVRQHVEELAAGEVPAYGISTGFGALANKHIPQESRAQLQKSLIRSHAAGMGPAVEKEVVRALMFLRATTLASGRTGVRPQVVQTMVDLLNADITPVVHEYGSLGCSGDLAPLSHVALALMGEGPASGPDGEVKDSGELMRAAGIEPVQLREKEGLALVNGTEGMLGMLILALHDLDTLADALDLTAAMSVEALLGTDRVFVPELHAPLRPHPGQAVAADRMLRILADSPIVASHREGDSRVQDAYSLRCAPQVAGGLRDTLAYVRGVAERELAATIDNPVVLPDGRVCSNGNFHGAPVAYVLDFLAIPVADAASMAERRTDRMLDPARSHGLPAFLVDDPGVDSGMMIAQYTQAGLVSDMKRLAVPASVDSIPSSAMQEDHVSMGWHAARKLRTAVENFRRVLAVELVAAARAIELRAPLQPAAATGAAVRVLREAGVPGPGPDQFMAPQLAAAEQALRDGSVLAAVEQALGAAGQEAGAERPLA
ncbi:histidine ammonia-lyase [Micrococcus sp.]|uniref:histidine ammonia-lyase n=1 Tax=Micrococcus sp. TaxID=1271 RepID=UPI002A90BB84|nr:histidine ammonia-lyase [Micrococcus sp.]MDY6055860.1 histidine ammonia-lyase [Micrococcus sp.]